MITMRHALCITVVACAVLAGMDAATAQNYPNRPIRFVVPAAAGGSADVTGRILAEHLGRALGQQVYIEHKPGASGTIGIEGCRQELARWLHGPHRSRLGGEQSARLQREH